MGRAVWAACAVLVTEQAPPLEQVLERAAVYVEEFERQLSGIVAEETTFSRCAPRKAIRCA
jgi:hypothetical protein